jgi:hypothetical protein
VADVSVVALTTGEAHTARALASIESQTLQPVEIVSVGPEITPFHRAFNAAVAKVNTEFFIEVDADMVLDDACIEALRACMDDRVGVVTGLLRDPILTRISGIHLFRTRCFEQARYRDSIIPETDFRTAIAKRGWQLLFALRPDVPWDSRHTFGRHEPDYTPAYTFRRFFVEGARNRVRKQGTRTRGLLFQLLHSPHPLGALATIAAAHGLFLAEQRDLLFPAPPSEEFHALDAFLSAAPEAGGRIHIPRIRPGESLEEIFGRSLELGIGARQRRAAATFLQAMREIYRAPSVPAFVSLVGLCHGVFVERYDRTAAAQDFATLTDVIS